MTLYAVLIHGYPDRGVHPSIQLSHIREFLRTLGYVIWDDYCWASDDSERLSALRALQKRDRQFTKEFAEHFQEWMGSKLSELSISDSVIVIAYSAGGAIFYQWICSIASKQELSMISIVATIASPHSFPQQMTVDGHNFKVDEAPIPRDAIVSILSENQCQFKVFLARRDTMIPLQFGIFEGLLESDQIIIDATHKSILESIEVINNLQRWLLETG